MNKTLVPTKQQIADHNAKQTLTVEQADKIYTDREAELPVLRTLWSSDASLTRAKMVAFTDAGFTRDEAFAIVMKDRK